MDQANVALSLFLPLIVSLVKQSGFDDRVNRAIALAVYFAWAIIATVSVSGLNLTAFLSTFGTTLVTGSLAYEKIWKGFGIDDTLTDKTSFVKAPQEDVVIEG